MLESAEITLAPGMDRDTAVPPPHLHAAPWRNGLLSALASVLVGLVGSTGLMGNAQALGLGRPLAQSVLGQPLVLTFPLSLRAGESLSMDCVSVEVVAGGVKLPAGKVGVRLEGDSESTLRAIRVLSSVPIEEPILSVTLSLGCPVRLTRQFSALMDPPSVQEGVLPDARSSGESPRVLSPALRAALATSDAKPKELLGANLSGALGQERLTASKTTAAVAAASTQGEAKIKPKKSVEPSAARTSKPPKVAAAPVAVAALVAEPQLRLEVFDADSAAAKQAAAAASAAEAAMARLQQVEVGLQGLQAEYRSNALKLGAMQQGLAAGALPASGDSSNAVSWGLGALALLLGAGVVYLWRSRSRHQAGQGSDWWEHAQHAAVAEVAQPVLTPASAAQVEPEPPPGTAPEEQTMALPRSVTAEFSPAPNTVPAELPDKETTGLARISQLMAADLSLEPLSVQFIDPSDSVAAAFGGAVDSVAADPPWVSVEELIDLEQQVDFFMVLGQDEAAVDLLHGQLQQGVAGANISALPYLKLMEICQQRGDALAFADVAGRYAVTFNASPPAWDANLEHGPGLEGYAEVIRSLQSRWSDSGASMVALQKLLSSKDGRSASFDLPALRDLLLLYSVARDRSEHEVRGEEIDLFLPLEPDLEAGHPTGFDLMATMVWQGRTGRPSTSAPADVDILLDDSSVPDQRL